MFLVFPLLAQSPEARWDDLITQGQHYAAARDLAHAEQSFQKALHEAERFGIDDWRVAVSLEALGRVYSDQHRGAEAEASYARALAIFEDADGSGSLEVANVEFDRARLALATRRPADAILLARKTLPVYERLLGARDLQTAAVVCLIGDSLRTMKNYTDAEEPLRRCADIRENTGGIDSTELADALHSLALTYTAQQKYALADARFKLAEKIRENKLGLTSPVLAQTLEDHAALLRLMGRMQDAARLTLLSAAIRRNQTKSIRYPEKTR